MSDVVRQTAEELISFIDSAPTAYHACHEIEQKLFAQGFTELLAENHWQLAVGGRYYVKRNQSSLIAFIVGSLPIVEAGFNIAGAHTDSPSFRLKPHGEKYDNGCFKVTVEMYGGPIVHSWLDRDLSLAGRVVLNSQGKLQTKLVKFDKPLCIIPNLAIHLNREVNKGFEFNVQTHLPVVFTAGGTVATADKPTLRTLLATKLAEPAENIADYDLFLCDTQKGVITGINDDLICSGRLDNLAMCHAILQALCVNAAPAATLVAAFYDNEEIGSVTPMGADSNFLRDLLDRIGSLLCSHREDFHRALARSLLVSADGAHGVHPNFAEKHDSSYVPMLGRGPVIKAHANYRYSTNALSAAKFAAYCQAAAVPFQYFVSRSDLPCGSTIGPVTSALLGIPAVDVGNPMWAMHSIRETQGTHDHYYMIQALKKFYRP